jgi:hypothetical protein
VVTSEPWQRCPDPDERVPETSVPKRVRTSIPKLLAEPHGWVTEQAADSLKWALRRGGLAGREADQARQLVGSATPLVAERDLSPRDFCRAPRFYQPPTTHQQIRGAALPIVASRPVLLHHVT